MKRCRNVVPKNVFALACVLLIVMSLLTACGTPGTKIKSRYDLDVVDHTSNFYVNDFADLFTDAQEKELMENAVAFDEEYSGIQVVITTVDYLNDAVVGYEYAVRDQNGNLIEDAGETAPEEEPKFTIEEITYSMYKEYGIGQDDMGILILFAAEDGEVRIETGNQMQVYITDSISGRILDNYGMDYFYDGKYAEGLISVQTAIIDTIKEKVSIDWYTASQTEKEETKETEPEKETVVGNVSGDTNKPAGVDQAEPEGKDPSGGILWGLFGSIGAAFAAIFAFIRQKLKGDSDKKMLEQEKADEIQSMKAGYEATLLEKEQAYQRSLDAERSNHEREIRQKNSQISTLEGNLRKAQNQVGTLTNQLAKLTDTFERAQKLHPESNFEAEVAEMIVNEYKAAARQIDEKLAVVFGTKATKDNAHVYRDAMSLIDSADENVRKYISSDRAQLQTFYDESIRLKKEFERQEQEKRDRAAAKNAYDKINGIYDGNLRGDHNSYKTLHSALAIFLGLNAAQRAFFPDNDMISRLRKVHGEAESDYNDYTAAKNAESSVEGIIGYMGTADEDDRSKLDRAMGYYRNLSSSERAYFSDAILNKLKRLIQQADEDHTRQERRRREERERREREEREEQERRRRAAAAAAAARRSSSSSSFRSSGSSFSGRGGRPSGGGASRRFK